MPFLALSGAPWRFLALLSALWRFLAHAGGSICRITTVCERRVAGLPNRPRRRGAAVARPFPYPLRPWRRREVSKRNPRRRSGRDALVRRVRALGEPCWICGLPIDATLPAGHPLAFELDELVPVSKGGSPVDFENCKGAHRACNQWRQARSVASVIAIRDEVRRRFGPWPSSFAFLEGARAVLRGAKGRIGKAPVRHPKRSSGAL